MSEMTKTLAFVVAAVGVLACAFASRPSSADLDLKSLVGEVLGNFEPSDAKRLSIVEFDEETATLKNFEVAQDETGLWTLPSKNGYPADAERQMGEATGSLDNREVLAVLSNSAADHQQYGVIDPASSKLEVGAEGVGTRVTVSDINDTGLIDLIIGKEVKDSDGQRYVREAKRDMVYATEIDPSKLSTRFEDWIEDDLLELNAWDIQQVRINDYSAELVMVGFQPQISWDRRGEYELQFDDKESKWSATSLRVYDKEASDFVEAPLAEGEELRANKLNELKSALDDLRIVDVEKKPTGLSANLKAGEGFLKDSQSLSSLVRRGFAAVPLTEGELDLLSSEGEVICTMKDGVEYVLRFGNLQVSAESESEQPPAEEANPAQSGVNRYLFAMARVNEDAIAKPELEELPEMPAEESSAELDEEEGDDEKEAAEDDAAEGEDESEDEIEELETDDEAAKVAAERKQIEAENQRKIVDHQKAIEAAGEKVAELNLRFGDWYYVIANDVFQKIRLKRDDLVKVPEPVAEESASESEATEGADAVEE